jgi:hypothetical protein
MGGFPQAFRGIDELGGIGLRSGVDLFNGIDLRGGIGLYVCADLLSGIDFSHHRLTPVGITSLLGKSSEALSQ